MRLFAYVLAIIAAAAGPAGANGRPPATSTIHFQQGNDQNIIAGMTFGLVISHDGGATWHWMCEKAVGYAGMYDPIYAYSQSGAIFATTFDGLKVMRDGCSFVATPPGMTFVSQDVLAPDHALYITAADPNDANIYKSTNDGTTFPPTGSQQPGLANDWWQSIIIAPSDASRVYVSGYRFVMACDQNSPVPLKTCTVASDCQDSTHMNGTCEGQKKWLLYKSTDGGATFSALPGNLQFATQNASVGLTTSINSAINFVGVDHANANILYATVSLENGQLGDGAYKIDTSTGTTWTHLKSVADQISFLARGNGDLVLATPTLGAFKSTNAGTTWTALTSPPHINCLTENGAGVVYACTQNFGTQTTPSDGYGIMKSSDFSSWTGVLRFQDIAGPVTCDPSTVQQTQCVQNAMTGATNTGLWCGLVAQLGIANSPIDCSLVDGAPDVTKPAKKGCCDAGSGAGTPALLSGVVVCGLLLRRRRPRVR